MQKKFGFTITEVVIATVIVGVVSAISILSFKPEFDAKRRAGYYAQVYKTLKTAAYNAYLEQHGNFGTTSGTGSDITDFCNDLTEQINTSKKDCSLHGRDSSNQNDFAYDKNEPGDLKRPHFIAANGISFWISQAYPLYNRNDSYNNQIGDRFYAVFADINPNGKNKVLRTDNNNGDIVPFIITRHGEVIPMGEPIRDQKIVKAGVKISYKYTDGNGYVSERSTVVPAESLAEAYKMAWGKTVWANNPLSYDYFHDNSTNSLDTKWRTIGRRTDSGENPTDCKTTANENVKYRGGAVCATVEIDSAGNTYDICCQTCKYNCTAIILNKK